MKLLQYIVIQDLNNTIPVGSQHFENKEAAAILITTAHS